MKPAIGNVRFFLLSLTSAWCIGIGLRFIFMDTSKEIYVNGVFDKFFDWGGLFILGCLLFIYCIFEFGKVVKDKKVEKLWKEV